MPEIKVVENIRKANDQIAAANRERLDRQGILAVMKRKTHADGLFFHPGIHGVLQCFPDQCVSAPVQLLGTAFSGKELCFKRVTACGSWSSLLESPEVVGRHCTTSRRASFVT